MSSSLTVLPDALRYLRERLAATQSDVAGLAQVLRALQRLSLRQVDLQIYIERIRATNEATARDDTLEKNCLAALDIVTGLAGDDSLRWDAAEMARYLLPRVINQNDIEGSIDPALSRSDMLPPRVHTVPLDDFRAILSQQLAARLEAAAVEPQRADFFRVPKAGFTTRPAALLAPSDRMCWEALANDVERELHEVASPSLIWPRNREHIDYSVFAREPLNWESTHLVRTDIESFYDSIDHAVLSLALGDALGLNSTFTRAVEAFLDSVMGGGVGLPQGPPASEVFASCFLLLVDRQLDAANIKYVRYADDYVLAANSVLDGRQKLEQLESALRDVGLRLSPAKTKVLKYSTYSDNLGSGVSPRVVALRDRLRAITEDRLRSSEDEDGVEEILRSLGTEEQTLFDLLYHRTTSLDEVIENIGDRLSPTLAQSYATYVHEEAEKLRAGDYPADTQISQADLEEAFLALASAKVRVTTEDVLTALTWHPVLAPAISAYARNIGSVAADHTRDLLNRWLESGANTDWVQAWGCSAAEVASALVDDALAGRLEEIALSAHVGPLTRVGAARTLAAARRLSRPVWQAVLGRSSLPMRAELYLDAEAEPDAYPMNTATPGQNSLAN